MPVAPLIPASPRVDGSRVHAEGLIVGMKILATRVWRWLGEPAPLDPERRTLDGWAILDGWVVAVTAVRDATWAPGYWRTADGTILARGVDLFATRVEADAALLRRTTTRLTDAGMGVVCSPAAHPERSGSVVELAHA